MTLSEFFSKHGLSLQQQQDNSGLFNIQGDLPSILSVLVPLLDGVSVRRIEQYHNLVIMEQNPRIILSMTL